MRRRNRRAEATASAEPQIFVLRIFSKNSCLEDLFLQNLQEKYLKYCFIFYYYFGESSLGVVFFCILRNTGSQLGGRTRHGWPRTAKQPRPETPTLGARIAPFFLRPAKLVVRPPPDKKAPGKI
jgi:hypothetical protein